MPKPIPLIALTVLTVLLVGNDFLRLKDVTVTAAQISPRKQISLAGFEAAYTNDDGMPGQFICQTPCQLSGKQTYWIASVRYQPVP